MSSRKPVALSGEFETSARNPRNMLWPLWAYDAVVAHRSVAANRPVDAERDRDPRFVRGTPRRVVIRVERQWTADRLRALAHDAGWPAADSSQLRSAESHSLSIRSHFATAPVARARG